MKFRSLGNSNLKVSALGLGCMAMSEFYGAIDHEEVVATLHDAVAKGINFFDTADMYGTGANEVLLGEILKPYRKDIVLATKFGFIRDPNNPVARPLNGRPEYVMAACEASLKRLNTDVIDLYYLHRIDPAVPVAETVGAMAELVKQGKVRYLGLSEVGSNTLQAMHKIHPITALQTEYSLWSRDPEKALIPTCEKLNIAFIPYSPLGRGFLTNKMTAEQITAKDDFRKILPRFIGENFLHNQQLVEKLAALAKAKNCTSAQYALAWILAKSENIIPIPGTRRRKYLAENINAINVELSAAEIAALDDLFKPEEIAGDRYNDIGMELVEE